MNIILITISGILTWKSTKPTLITQAGDCMRKHCIFKRYKQIQNFNQYNRNVENHLNVATYLRYINKYYLKACKLYKLLCLFVSW